MAFENRLINFLGRFSLVGGLATATYLIVSNGLILYGFTPVVASLIAYIIGLIISFFGQLIYTFRIKKASFFHYFKFGLLTIFGILFAQLVIYFFVIMGWQPSIGTIIVAIFIPILNLFAMKYWVFSDSKNSY